MSPNQILKYLEEISINNLYINFMMHLVVITIMINILFNKNIKTNRYIIYGGILTLYLSVMIQAIIYGNPFHFITFLFLVIAAIYQLIVNKEPVKVKFDVWSYLAFIFIIIGFIYPEFIKKDLLHLLFTSPVGVIPCPTLLTVLGLLMLLNNNKQKFLFISTVVMASIYGMIGVFVLKVYIDIALFFLVFIAIYQVRYKK